MERLMEGPNESDWQLIPEHIRESVKNYIEDGCPVGDFLQAVIRNELCEAVGRADSINRNRLYDIIYFFYNFAPGACWGSPEKMQAWMEMHRKERDLVHQLILKCLPRSST